MRFGTDQVLLYNVDPWDKLGFGVPNFGDNLFTQNAPLHRLANEIAVVQLFIMTHIDATRRQYPSRNTVERLGKVLNRVQSVLQNRARAASEMRLEAGHGSPAPMAWNIHPCPYFAGPIVANSWLAEYNHLTMVALTNIYQHSDNNLSLTITAELASDIAQYFYEMRRLLAGELLGVKPEVYSADGFTFGAELYASYSPDKFVIRVEGIDDPGDVRARFTEDDLRPFLVGIPANLIVPNLAKYPTGPNDNFDGSRGAAVQDKNAAPGVKAGNFEPVV